MIGSFFRGRSQGADQTLGTAELYLALNISTTYAQYSAQLHLCLRSSLTHHVPL